MRNRWHASRSRVRPPTKRSRANNNIGSNDGRNWATSLCGLGFVVFTLLSSVGCGNKNVSAAAAPPPNVQIAEVIQRDVPIYHEYLATLDGFVNAQIQPQVSGYLIKQNYLEGALVGRNQILFKIDPRPFQAIVDQAKAQVAQAEAQLGKTQLDVQRDTPLAKERAIAQSQLDNDIQANLAAKATVQADQGGSGTGGTESGIHQRPFAGRRRCRNRHRPGGKSCGPANVAHNGFSARADQSLLYGERTGIPGLRQAQSDGGGSSGAGETI